MQKENVVEGSLKNEIFINFLLFFLFSIFLSFSFNLIFENARVTFLYYLESTGEELELFLSFVFEVVAFSLLSLLLIYFIEKEVFFSKVFLIGYFVFFSFFYVVAFFPFSFSMIIYKDYMEYSYSYLSSLDFLIFFVTVAVSSLLLTRVFELGKLEREGLKLNVLIPSAISFGCVGCGFLLTYLLSILGVALIFPLGGLEVRLISLLTLLFVSLWGWKNHENTRFKNT